MRFTTKRTGAPNKVLFNPASGDLWWQRGEGMLSTSVPSRGTPQSQGRGFLYAFTPAGEPMPMPFFDSPSGELRAVLTEDGYDATVYVGTAADLSSDCLQGAGIDHHSEEVTACGAHRLSPDRSPCSQVDEFGGWVSDSEIVCVNDEDQLVLVSINPNGAILDETALTPPTEQELDNPLVTPGGDTVFFLADDSSGVTTLYRSRTGGGTEVDPEELDSWSDGSVTSLLGWREELP